MDRVELLAHARNAALKAYAPFSAFRVGAALVVVDETGGERVVSGCNVENASYGLSFCAERNALSTAVSQFGAGLANRTSGPRITQFAIACIDAPQGAETSLLSPCGACRQWIAELAPDAEIMLDGHDGQFSLDDLLPFPFRLK